MNQLLTHSNIIDPYPIYNAIRDTTPVYNLQANTWVISQYEDVKNGLKNHKQFVSNKKMELCTPSFLSKNCQSDLFIATEDPPEYNIHRSAISSPLEKTTIDAFKTNIIKQAIISTNNIKEKKQIEFFKDFSYPYVGNTINQLFGFDDLQEYADSHKWIKAVETTTIPNINKNDVKHIENIILKQKSLFEHLIIKKRKRPTNDFISHFVNRKINGSTLTTQQSINALELLYRGGYQTTVHLLATVATQLIRNSFLRNELIESPELIPQFIDEILRLYSPVPMVIRHAAEDVTVRDVTIPKGDLVWFSLAGANRDPNFFSNPNKIDLHRQVKNVTIAFGYGPHICMGVYLAKMEIDIAIHHLLPLFSVMSCPEDKDLKWINTLVFRGLEELPIINT